VFDVLGADGLKSALFVFRFVFRLEKALLRAGLVGVRLDRILRG